jgi:rhamnosyltransferase
MDSYVDLVVVTYYPDRKRLKEGLLSLSGQVRNLILVSNNPDDFSDLTLPVIHLDLKENRGIGYAQNVGIRKALNLGAQFVLTSDQDTVYPLGYVKSIMKIFEDLTRSGRKVGAVGPVFKDENHQGKIHPMVKFGTIGLSKFFGEENFHPVSHMISSGMLIPITSFQTIGFMKEEFFMDWIDTEWCWRGVKFGREIVQVPSVVVSHSLGNSSIDLLGISVTSHSYPREYFKIRNAIFLLTDSTFPDFPVRLYLSLFIVKNLGVNFIKGFGNTIHFKVIFYSILHGIRSKTGPCPF